jgi:hypothetical protein
LLFLLLTVCSPGQHTPNNPKNNNQNQLAPKLAGFFMPSFIATIYRHHLSLPFTTQLHIALLIEVVGCRNSTLWFRINFPSCFKRF